MISLGVIVDLLRERQARFEAESRCAAAAALAADVEREARISWAWRVHLSAGGVMDIAL